MSQPEPLHRFPNAMARNVHDAIGLISSRYGGDAARIWRGCPSSATVVLRFLEFRGVGPKIATMAANILARELKVPFSDYYSVDISVDVHVRRVFGRLGLVAQGASAEVITYTARAISPEFPGILDYPAFEIVRAWCRPRNPACGECTMFAVCPSADR